MFGFDPHDWEDRFDIEKSLDYEDDFCDDCNELRDETGRHVYCPECETYLKAAGAL